MMIDAGMRTRLQTDFHSTINNQQPTMGGAAELRLSFLRPDHKQFLAIFDGLPVGHQFFYNLARHVGLDLIEQLHGLDNAHDLSDLHAVSHFHKGRSSGRGRLVERSHDRRLHRVQSFFLWRFCRGAWCGSYRCARHRYGSYLDDRSGWRHREKSRFTVTMHNRVLPARLIRTLTSPRSSSNSAMSFSMRNSMSS